MFIKNIKKHKAEISKFEFAYKVLHPEEIAPTYEILVELSKDVDKIFLGEYNICLFKELEDKSFEAIAFWCIASKKLPIKENKKCFLEISRAISNLKQKVIISNINDYYKKATQPLNNEYYLFKVSK
jgi:hypothetical protein